MKSLLLALAGSAVVAATPLRERDGWVDWESAGSKSTTTPTKPVLATTTPAAGSSCVYTSSGAVKTGYGAECSEWSEWTTSTTTTTTKPVKATTTTVVSCVYTASGVVATGYGPECTEWADWSSSTTTSTPSKPTPPTGGNGVPPPGNKPPTGGNGVPPPTGGNGGSPPRGPPTGGNGVPPTGGNGTPPNGPPTGGNGVPPTGGNGTPPSGPPTGGNGTPPSGPSCPTCPTCPTTPPTPAKCLSDAQATSIVNQFVYLLEQPQAADFAQKANALLSDDFVDFSDSISWLAGAPVTFPPTPIFPNKTAFIFGQGAQPPIPTVKTQSIFHDCANIAWKWTGLGIGSGQFPVSGIDLFKVTDHQQISQVQAEFDVGAWEANIGGTCTHPPFPSST